MDGSATMNLSPPDLLSALLTGQTEKLNITSSLAARILSHSPQLLTILTTFIAVLIVCLLLLVWRRSTSSNSKVVEPLKPLIVKEPELEIDDGRKKVTIFYDTQTGTAEGFAKALAEEAKARYDKAVFNVVDLDDYVADDEEYEAKLKKESISFFFLATYGDVEPTDNAARFYKWFTEGGEDRGQWLKSFSLEYAYEETNVYILHKKVKV